jgi:hypothetical protein
MKCGKCGFVSFDYLTECKSCGANLAGSRENLGLPAGRPAASFFLGSLLKDHAKSDTKADKDLTAGSTLPAIDFNEPDDFLLDDVNTGMGRKFAAAPAGIAAGQPAMPGVADDELQDMDLSDEELDLLIAHDRDSDEPGGGELGVGMQTETAAGRTAVAQSEDLEDDELDLAALDELSMEMGEEIPQSAPSASANTRTGAPPAAAGIDDGLVLDLSETDVDGMFADPDETPSKQTKQAVNSAD